MEKNRKLLNFLAMITIGSPSFKSNKKIILGSVIIFLLVSSMLLTISPVRATGATSGSFSAVSSGTGGTTNVNSVSLPSSPNPVGSSVKFDIYISGASNIWGWSISTVSWNPAVLSLAKVTEGSFLADNTGGDPTSMAGLSKTLWDNAKGDIQGGLAEAIEAPDVSIDSSGVVATLTFNVVGYGNSAVIITEGNLRATSGDNTGVSASCNSASLQINQPVTSLSLYQGGTTNPNIQYPALQNPINATFKVDIYINYAAGVWGWNAGITWDPNVIQLTSVDEGSYLRQGGATLFTPGNIDNYFGKIRNGISDSLLLNLNASALSGVLATLTFTVVSYSDCNINLTSGIPSTLLNQNIPHQEIPVLAMNNATYSWNPAAPTGPKAVITTSGSPFGAGSNQTLTDYSITLDGSKSVAGLNMVPPYQNCPITEYSWSITLVNGTIVTSNTLSVALSADEIGPSPGTIFAFLTVIAASPTNTPAPTYAPINTTIFTLYVLQPLKTNDFLDIWTQNGGQGLNANATAFGPQQEIELTAYATNNGSLVVGQEVRFDIYLNGSYIDFCQAATNATGYATVSYSFPTQYLFSFGVVTIVGTINLPNVSLSDTCQFFYGYILDLQSVNITNGVYDSQNIGPVFYRNLAGLNIVTIQATVNSANWVQQPFYLTATIFDNGSVPVACQILSETAPAAIGNNASSSNTQTYTISLNIPTYAFVGPATVYVDIFNGNPSQNGIGFSPEQSTQLYIYYGT